MVRRERTQEALTVPTATVSLREAHQRLPFAASKRLSTRVTEGVGGLARGGDINSTLVIMAGTSAARCGCQTWRCEKPALCWAADFIFPQNPARGFLARRVISTLGCTIEVAGPRHRHKGP